MVLDYHPKIYSLFRRMVPTHDEADDLTQETFIKVYKNLNKFERQSSMYTWIYRIAVNTGLNYLRKQKLRQNLGVEMLSHWMPQKEEQDTDGNQRSLLRQAVAKLPGRQQMVILLRSFQDLSFREVAAAMESTENAAKVNYSHALRNLRKILTDMGLDYDSM